MPVIRAIEGTTERPAPGDLAWTGELWVVLDDAGPHAWVNEPAGDGHHGARVWSLADGRRRLVGLRVHDAAHVEDLDDVDWRSLRGIEFEVWTDELAGLLARIDPARCAVHFAGWIHADDLPSLPVGIRYLDLGPVRVRDGARLDQLRELRFLRLQGKEITSLDWVREMPELRWLELDGAKVSDLRPLGGHAKLRAVHLSSTPVQRLPAMPLPSLEHATAYACGCPADEVERFQMLHPSARLELSSGAMLRAALRGAAKVCIRRDATCCPLPTATVLFETGRDAEVAELIDLLRTDDSYTPPYAVPGCEQHVLAFLDRDGATLLEVGLFGADMLRCGRLWTKPIRLAAGVEAPLRQWLTQRGIELF